MGWTCGYVMIEQGTSLKTSVFFWAYLPKTNNSLCHNCPTHLRWFIQVIKCPIPISHLYSQFMCGKFVQKIEHWCGQPLLVLPQSDTQPQHASCPHLPWIHQTTCISTFPLPFLQATKNVGGGNDPGNDPGNEGKGTPSLAITATLKVCSYAAKYFTSVY